MTLCETAAGVATVGETIRAKPLTKSAMYRCTVLAKADNAVTVQFTDPDLKKQDVQMLWNWERVQILRELTSAEQAAIKGIKRQEGIFNQIVAVFKGMQSQCIGTDSVVQLPGCAKAEVSQLLNELAAAGMKLAEADMERAWELALEQATEEAQRLAEEQKLAKQKRISEVEKQLARIYKTVELQRFGQEGLGEVQGDLWTEVNQLFKVLTSEGISQDKATSWASELHHAAKLDVQWEAGEAWERANREAVQMRLRASGQSNLKNELNKAAFLACTQGDVQALRDAAGGCFATFELKEEMAGEFFDGAGWFEDWIEVGYDYGLHFIKFGPELPAEHTGMQSGTTLLGAAKVLGWSQLISEALETMGVPLTYRHNQREIVGSYIVTAQASAEKDGSVRLINSSGEILDVSVNRCTAAALGEKVRWLKSIPGNADMKILLPDGRVLAPQEEVSSEKIQQSATKRARRTSCTAAEV
mmetsp:Transcript_41956/g.74170  ORF Transcript_41956/g.74170 Transcript_41956/m.74170 type:complete len:473 (-) Transcript_41956:4-1422(-)